MKRLFLIPALLLSFAAGAQEFDREMNPTENAWFKLQILTFAEPEYVADHLKSHGVTVENLDGLRAYVANSAKGLEALNQEKTEYVCTNRAKFENDTEALAQYFEQWTADEAAAVQRIVDGLTGAIGETGAISFQSFVEIEGKGRTGGVDRSAALRTGKLSPKFLVGRVCGEK